MGTHPDCATLKPPSRVVVGTSFLEPTLDLRHNTAVYLSCVVGGQKKDLPIASFSTNLIHLSHISNMLKSKLKQNKT